MLSIRQIRYFDQLARHRHFGRAAEAAAVTQPALSMQIKDMEARLGCTLFERRSDGVLLTEDGVAVLRHVRAVLDAMRGLDDYEPVQTMPLSGTLRLGIIPTIAPYLLPELLPCLSREAPALTLNIRESRTQDLLAALDEGVLDLALVALPVEARDLTALSLFDDPFHLAVPAGSATYGPLPAQDLDTASLLLLEEGHCLRDQALQVCAQMPERLRTFGAASLTTLVQLVASGQGMTFIPDLAAPVEVSGRAVRLVPFEAPVPKRTIGLVWRRSSPRGASFEALGQLIRQVRGGEGLVV